MSLWDGESGNVGTKRPLSLSYIRVKYQDFEKSYLKRFGIDLNEEVCRITSLIEHEVMSGATRVLVKPLNVSLSKDEFHVYARCIMRELSRYDFKTKLVLKVDSKGCITADTCFVEVTGWV